MKHQPPEKTGAIVSAAGNQMKMHVRNVLVGGLAVIQQIMRTVHTEPGGALRRDDAVAHRKKMVPYGIVKSFKLLRMLLWNDEHMTSAERVNVHERYAEFIFMHMDCRLGSEGAPRRVVKGEQ